MGSANSVGLPGTHLNSVANTHNDPIVRSNESSLNGKLVVEDANTNARNVGSAPSKIGEDHGHATMVANSISASLDSESEHSNSTERRNATMAPATWGLENVASIGIRLKHWRPF